MSMTVNTNCRTHPFTAANCPSSSSMTEGTHADWNKDTVFNIPHGSQLTVRPSFVGSGDDGFCVSDLCIVSSDGTKVYKWTNDNDAEKKRGWLKRGPTAGGNAGMCPNPHIVNTPGSQDFTLTETTGTSC